MAVCVCGQLRVCVYVCTTTSRCVCVPKTGPAVPEVPRPPTRLVPLVLPVPSDALPRVFPAQPQAGSGDNKPSELAAAVPVREMVRPIRLLLRIASY